VLECWTAPPPRDEDLQRSLRVPRYAPFDLLRTGSTHSAKQSRRTNGVASSHVPWPAVNESLRSGMELLLWSELLGPRNAHSDGWVLFVSTCVPCGAAE
jgi:hypothetical protein